MATGDINELFPQKKNKINSLLWLFEPLENDPRFLRQKFFSFDAAYLEGWLYLALSDREEPWNGLMVCTSQQHHGSLQAEFPQLIPHPVIGKWLYLSQCHVDFESIALDLIVLAARRDPRLGVETGKRKSSKGKVRKKRPG